MGDFFKTEYNTLAPTTFYVIRDANGNYGSGDCVYYGGRWGYFKFTTVLAAAKRFSSVTEAAIRLAKHESAHLYTIAKVTETPGKTERVITATRNIDASKPVVLVEGLFKRTEWCYLAVCACPEGFLNQTWALEEATIFPDLAEAFAAVGRYARNSASAPLGTIHAHNVEVRTTDSTYTVTAL